MHRAVSLVPVIASIAVFVSGCCSTTPTNARCGEKKCAERIELTVGADQTMVMNGMKVDVTDVPKQLSKVNADKYLIIVVEPDSKLLPETLVTLLNVLKKDGYDYKMGEDSKYADILIKKQS